MSYIATIKSSSLEEGMLKVVVRFENKESGEMFDELFETNQPQPPGWIEENVTRKLKHLDGLGTTYAQIEVGAEIKTETVSPVQKNGESLESLKEIYRKKLEQFNKMVGVTQQGILSRDNPSFLALKKELADEFKPEYVDLF